MQEDCQLRGEPGANDELLSGVALSKHLQQLQKVTGSRGSEKAACADGAHSCPTTLCMPLHVLHDMAERYLWRHHGVVFRCSPVNKHPTEYIALQQNLHSHCHAVLLCCLSLCSRSTGLQALHFERHGPGGIRSPRAVPLNVYAH